MALLVAVIVTLFATAFGKPQFYSIGQMPPLPPLPPMPPLVPTNGVVTPHYYHQPLAYWYPGMAHQTYFHTNHFLGPYTYPVNFAASSVVQGSKVQPYYVLTHCAKLKEKVTELFNLVDANLDRKVTLAELRDDTLDTDPRVIAIWKHVFENLVGDTSVFDESSDDKYTEELERPLFAKNDVNYDHSLNSIEFSNFVGDMFDVGIFFQPYDANRDYYLDKTEYAKLPGWPTMSVTESVVGSNDEKLSVVEMLTLVSLLNNSDLGNDICAKKKVRSLPYMG